MKKVKCRRCNGSGAVYMKLHSPRNITEPVEHYLICPQPACRNGVVDTDEYYAQWELKNKELHE